MSLIQWYPGHIAKAEKALKEQLKLVDVVLEIRDARIPFASHHPRISTWTEGRSHILVMNRVDMIPVELQKEWIIWFKQRGQVVYFTDAQSGKGIANLLKAAQNEGIKVNERRRNRGMLPRPVRAVVIGFPNVGKSALINRLLKKRVAPSANRPGVTRQLRWIRISDQIELLDTPGILPPLLEDQAAALKLAICDDIADAAYDSTLVAAAAIEMLVEQGITLEHRYGLNAALGSGMDFLVNLGMRQNPGQSARASSEQIAAQEAEYNSENPMENIIENISGKTHSGNTEKAARQVLTDLRKGKLGAIALEHPI